MALPPHRPQLRTCPAFRRQPRQPRRSTTPHLRWPRPNRQLPLPLSNQAHLPLRRPGPARWPSSSSSPPSSSVLPYGRPPAALLLALRYGATEQPESAHLGPPARYPCQTANPRTSPPALWCDSRLPGTLSPAPSRRRSESAGRQQGRVHPRPEACRCTAEWS